VTAPRNRRAFVRGHALRAEIRTLLEQHPSLRPLCRRRTSASASPGNRCPPNGRSSGTPRRSQGLEGA